MIKTLRLAQLTRIARSLSIPHRAAASTFAPSFQLSTIPRAVPVPNAIASESPAPHSLALVSTHKASIHDAVKQLAANSAQNEPFFLLDVGDVYRKHEAWTAALPRVEPFYAVKCNSDPLVLQSLASLGTGFDCASLVEMRTMLNYGVDAKKLIYAHPCKPPSHIRFAQEQGVELMTFDNEDEVMKIKSIYPEAKLVLRVHTDDSKAVCKLGKKFGAAPSEVSDVLKKAASLDMNVVGVSFHVGSGCFDASAFTEAIAVAREVFDEGARQGYRFSLLDVGGGFPGDASAPVGFHQIAPVLNQALDQYFPASMGVRFIAEPGRYYVASAGTLAVNIVSKRKLKAEKAGEAPTFFYYVNDGTYGTLNNVMYDHAEPAASPLHEQEGPTFSSTLWGPTCDSMDCITRTAMLPEMNIGDWITFRNSGAYTIAAGCTFNGFPRPKMVYTFSTPAGFDAAALPASFPLAPSHLEP